MEQKANITIDDHHITVEQDADSLRAGRFKSSPCFPGMAVKPWRTS